MSLVEQNGLDDGDGDWIWHGRVVDGPGWGRRGEGRARQVELDFFIKKNSVGERT